MFEQELFSPRRAQEVGTELITLLVLDLKVLLPEFGDKNVLANEQFNDTSPTFPIFRNIEILM